MHGAREPAADLQFSWLSSRIADDSGGITGRSNGAIFSRYCGSFDIFFVDWTDEFDRWLTNAEEQGGKLLEVAVALLQALNDLPAIGGRASVIVTFADGHETTLDLSQLR